MASNGIATPDAVTTGTTTTGTTTTGATTTGTTTTSATTTGTTTTGAAITGTAIPVIATLARTKARLFGSVVVFVIFLVIGIPFIKLPPTPWLRWGFVIPGFVCWTIVLIAFLFTRQTFWDLWESANSRNTGITICITIPMFVFLYIFYWWPQLLQPIINTSYTPLDSVPFPAVAILQKMGWPTQANLFTNETYRPECYLGSYDVAGPQCSGLTPDETSSAGTCQCTSAWDDKIRTSNISGSSYTFFQFLSNENLVPPTPTFLMLLKVSFFYNIAEATKSTQTESTVPSPGLSIAIFDRRYNISEALKGDQATLIDINALGTSSINLQIQRRTKGSASNYYYDPTISSIPAMNIVCDTSSTTLNEPCTTFLILRIPGTTMLDVKFQSALDWKGLIASAGAFYSFVQIIAWVFSGAAFETSPRPTLQRAQTLDRTKSD